MHAVPSNPSALSRNPLLHVLGVMVIGLSLAAPVAAQQPSAPAKTEKPVAKPAPKPAVKPEVAKDSKAVQPKTADSAAEAGPNENSTAASSEPSLPLPRFVSFRTDPVNLRTGPGVRYPVEWIYMRRRLPVEIIAEFETWRQIRDVDGAEGWVHQSMLSGRRTGMIKEKPQALRKTNADQSETLAMLEPGVVIDVQRCPGESPFCRVEINGMQGWLKRDQFWGVYAQEKIE
jgi:SH3-like domain-containing protein